MTEKASKPGLIWLVQRSFYAPRQLYQYLFEHPQALILAIIFYLLTIVMLGINLSLSYPLMKAFLGRFPFDLSAAQLSGLADDMVKVVLVHRINYLFLSAGAAFLIALITTGRARPVQAILATVWAILIATILGLIATILSVLISTTVQIGPLLLLAFLVIYFHLLIPAMMELCEFESWWGTFFIMIPVSIFVYILASILIGFFVDARALFDFTQMVLET